MAGGPVGPNDCSNDGADGTGGSPYEVADCCSYEGAAGAGGSPYEAVGYEGAAGADGGGP